MVPVLTPLTINNFTVPSSFKFAKEISNLSLDEGSVMASFDIKSLFTNIPLKETIEIIISKLFESGNEYIDCSLNNNIDEIHTLKKSDFRDLLEKAVLDMHFTFDGTIYKQIDGVAMGSPLGPTLANTFMCHMEEKWMSSCPIDFKPTFYRRYVDDTFLIFKSASHIPLFLEYFNTRHKNIEFTCDNEVDYKLPFLDMCIERKDNKLLTSIYRKPTFTGLLSKYDSFAPILYKKNLISTLVFRAFKLSSDCIKFNTDINFVKKVLLSNGYPLHFIEKIIKFTLNKLYVPYDKPESVNFDVPKPIIFFSNYFLGDVSKLVETQLKALFSKYYPQINLRVVYKSVDRLGDHFRLKDPTLRDCMSCLIYQYTCESCNALYIGKTAQHFKIRICQHQGISFRTGASLAVPVNSHIRDHCLGHGQKVNENNFKILDKCFYSSDLETLESLYVKTLKPTINVQSQSTPLMMFP